MPLFAIGLVDSDNGQFSSVIKMMFRTASTILIQLALLQLSLIPLATQNTFFSIAGGIAILYYAFNAGDDLKEILFSSNLGSNMLSKSLSSVRMITNVFRR